MPSVTFAGAPGPLLEGIQPRSGPTSGGNTFRLRGRGFDALPGGTLGVLFDGTPAGDVQKENDRSIRGTVPAHAVGHVIVVISIDGRPHPDPGTDQYEYREGTGTADCTSAAECDDLNPCTLDACATTCQNAPVDSPDDVAAGTTGCAGLTVPAKIGKKFVAGCTKLGQLETAPSDRKRAKLKKKAVKSFVKAAKAAGKAKPIAGACATELGAILEAARLYGESQ